MGFLRLFLGSKTVAIRAIAKSLTKQAIVCTGMSLFKYRIYISKDNRRQSMVITAMAYTHFFMHSFNRMYFQLYGSQKLIVAQNALFPIIAYEFNQYFSEVSNDIFFDAYDFIEPRLAECGQILSSDGSIMFLDRDSALSVFANVLCETIFNEPQSNNPIIIATIQEAAVDGLLNIDF